MRDPLLALSDDIEHTIDDAQACFLNGNWQYAQMRLRQAVTMIDALADEERKRKPASDDLQVNPNPSKSLDQRERASDEGGRSDG